VLLYWIFSLTAIFVGFFVYYLLTGDTPIEYLHSIEGTTEGNMIKLLFGGIIVVGMLTFALKMLFPPRRY
jgi:hypothetical protein